MSKATKTVQFKMPVPVQPVTANDWVESRVGQEPAPVRETATVTVLETPAEPIKRFTLDVSESLHRRIKAQCASRGEKMVEVIRQILEREFPAEGGAR